MEDVEKSEFCRIIILIGFWRIYVKKLVQPITRKYNFCYENNL